MVQEEQEKLVKMLDYWIEHNREHRAEFIEWADKAKGYAGASVQTCLIEAARHLETANQYLTRALKDLRG